MIRVVLLLLLLVSPAVGQTAGLASVRVYKFGGRDTAEANNDNLPDGTGSGWLITNDQVITAYHVVHRHRSGNKPVQVRFPDGWRTWATVQAVDLEKDLALLWINPHPTIKPIPLGCVPDEGEQVTIHGYGYDYEYVTRPGQLLNRCVNTVLPKNFQGNKDVFYYNKFSEHSGSADSQENGYWQYVNTVAVPGDSGGPVTYNGEVIGITLSITKSLSVFCRVDEVTKSFEGQLRFPELRIK